MNHTPEPWVTGTNFGCIHKGFPDGRRINGALAICQGNNEQANENARRIVACVNACAGIPTDKLEHIAKTRELINAINFMDLMDEVAKENGL